LQDLAEVRSRASLAVAAREGFTGGENAERIGAPAKPEVDLAKEERSLGILRLERKIGFERRERERRARRAVARGRFCRRRERARRRRRRRRS